MTESCTVAPPPTRYIIMMLKLVDGGGWIAMPDHLLWYVQTE